VILRNDHLTGNTLLGAGAVHHIMSVILRCGNYSVEQHHFVVAIGRPS